MISTCSQPLRSWKKILDAVGRRLLQVDEAAAAERVAPGKWSKKEIIGHLIDSAANNHQRFVRLSNEKELVFPAYQQAGWVRAQQYHARPWRDLVALWLAYNHHLAHVIRQLDPATAGHVWKSPSGNVDLGFLVTDYITHLRHHLDQLLEGAPLPFPPQAA